MYSIYDITNLYLYGSLDVPSDFSDESLIRDKDFVCEVELNINDYMDGPAKYIKPSDFEQIRLFLSGEGEFSFKQGGYTESEVFNELGLNEDYKYVTFKQYEYDVDSLDYAERVYVWNSNSLEIDEQVTRFFVSKDGTRYIENLSIIPLNNSPENFDFKTKGFFDQIADELILEDSIDPSRIGRMVKINFVGDRNLIARYDLDDFINDDGEPDLKNGSLLGALEPMLSVINRLEYYGVIKTIENDKAIIYGTSEADEISGVVTPKGNVNIKDGTLPLVSPRPLSEYADNGVYYIAGKGDDFITGTDKDDIIDAGDNNDTLDGGEGADVLIGGTGNDTYIVDNEGDIVTENAGEGDADILETSVDYNLDSSAEIETINLVESAQNVSGSDTDNKIIGNELDNKLEGKGGKDILDGGSGADTLEGGSGYDTYIADSTDTINDYDGKGTVKLNGDTLVGGTRTEDDPENTYYSSDGKYTYELNGSTLSVNGGLTINSFSKGDLRIRLETEENEPVEPPQHDPNAVVTRRLDPLVLDLNGSGSVETSSLETSSTYFDIDGDGIAERLGWINGQDGILVDDLNDNGSIDDISELFGSDQINGFDALRAAGDENGDGVIDEQDSIFERLQIWTDVNQDGLSQEDELHSLDSLGVEAIQLDHDVVNIDSSGNRIIAQGSSTIDGHSGYVAAFDLQFNNRITKDTESHSVDQSILQNLAERGVELPFLRGFGSVKDLQTVYAKDDELLNRLEDLASSESLKIYQGFDRVLADWSGLTQLRSEAGLNTDAPLNSSEKLWILESFSGVEQFKGVIESSYDAGFTPGVNRLRTDYVDGHFTELSIHFANRFIAQSTLANAFEGAFYSLSGNTLIVDDKAVLESSLVAYAKNSDSDNAAALFSQVYNEFRSGLNLDEAAMIAALEGYDNANVFYDFLTGDIQDISVGRSLYTGSSDRSYIVGTESSDSLNGGDGDDILDGHKGNDWLYGGDGNDTLNGGEGIDRLYGGQGNDEYFFGRESGQDFIYDNLGVNTVRLGAELLPSDISVFTSDGSSLVLEITGTQSRLTLDSWFTSSDFRSISVAFDDGTVWSESELYNFISAGTTDSDVLWGLETDDTLVGLGGNDVLNGQNGNDTLDGGKGDDLLYGGKGNDTLSGGLGDHDYLSGGRGNDTYLFNAGDGHTTINNYDSEADRHDILSLGAGINPGDISVKRSGIHLLLTFQSTGEVITVQNYFSQDGTGGYALNAIEFADGTSWDLTVVKEKVQQSSDGDDALYGYDIDDTLAGEGGNDSIYGGGGNDTLLGGEGNDTIRGDYGQDHVQGDAGNDRLYGGHGNDVLLGMEGDDTLYGDVGNDHLSGGAGNDVLNGGAGDDDYFFGLGDGHDRINDQQGRVTIYVSDLDLTTVVFRRDGRHLTVGFEGNDHDMVTLEWFYPTAGGPTDAGLYISSAGEDATYLSPADLDSLVLEPTNSDDVINGADQDDSINGLLGNDSLDGGAGNDSLSGDAGDDVLQGGQGDDSLSGGIGNDTLDGGAGNDSYEFTAGDGSDTVNNTGTTEDIDVINFADGVLPANVSVSRSGNHLHVNYGSSDQIVVTNFFSNEGDSQSAIDQINFTDGTQWSRDDLLDMALIGDGGDDLLTGYSTDDVLYGAEGHDTLNAGDGNDHLSGGAGDDTLNGEAGNDLLVGGTGNDSLNGGAGNDTYTFASGGGSDTLSDTDGVDRIEFSDVASTDTILRRSGSNLVIKFVGSDDQLTLQNQFTGDQANHISSSFETLVFADGVEWDFTDLLEQAVTGTDSADRIDGFDQADLINAGSGDDIVYAQAGNDAVNAGAGNDTVEGGEGNDDITGGSGNDTLHGGNDDDTLRGNDGNDVLYGDDGADVLEGGSGADHLYGGSQDDLLSGGTDNDVLEDYSGTNILHGNEGDDQINGVGQLFGDEGRDILTGSGSLDGGAGDDTLTSTGSSTLAGGTGNDTFYGSFSQETYFFNLGDGEDLIIETKPNKAYSNVNPSNDTLQFGSAILQSDISFERHGNDLEAVHSNGTDKVTIQNWYQEPTEHFKVNRFEFSDGTSLSDVDVEALVVSYGTDGADTLLGYRSEDDEIHSGAGDDQVWGRAGNDTIHGDSGNDYLDGDEGDDVLLGGTGDDNLVGRTGNDQLNGGADNDSLQGMEGNDTLIGAEGNDNLFGGADNDQLQGGEGDDYLDAGSGDDVVDGGAGNDQLKGGSGSDSFVTGTGNDTIVIGDNEGHDVINASDGGSNGIIFTGTLTIDRLSFTQDGDDLLISVDDGSAQTIRITDHFQGGENSIDWVQPAGSTLIATLQINQLAAGEDNDDFDAVVTGTASGEQLLGTNGNDLMQGLGGADQLYGFSGNDRLEGGDGNDRLQGGNGSNTNSGDDVLLGGAGDDILVGEDGDDRLEGGDGNDHYYYYAGTGKDVILDDGNGQDILFFNDVSPDRLSYHQDGDDLIVLVDGDLEQQVRVENHFLGGNNEIMVQPNGGYTQTAVAIATQLTALPTSGDGSGTSSPDPEPDTGSGGVTTDLSGDDTVSGADTRDILVSGVGNDTLSGGAGDDRLFGGAGNDTYIIGANSGKDTVVDVEGYNKVRFVDGITFNDVASGLMKSGDDLILNIGGNTNQLTISNFFSLASTIDTLEFETGGQLTAAQLFGAFGLAAPTASQVAKNLILGDGAANTVEGSANGDILITGRGVDTLSGLAGDDQLIGGADNDTYIIGANNGKDTVIDTDGTNTIRFVDGISFNDVASGLQKSGNDLILNVGGSSNQVRIESFFALRNTVDMLEFETGGEISAAQLFGAFGLSAPTSTAETRDILTDVYTGGSGDDTLIGSNRDDQLSGGAGNDALNGGTGNDRYFFNLGDGQDVITENDSSADTDVLDFGDNVSFEELWLSRSNDDLLINIAGSDDQVTINHWYTNMDSQLDEIEAGDSVLLNSRVEQLVTAMASYNVPSGVGNVIPQDTKDALQPLLASSWEVR